MYLGLFCLRGASLGDTFAVVMSNVFLPPYGSNLHTVFDMKGSTFHRQALSDDDIVSSRVVGRCH